MLRSGCARSAKALRSFRSLLGRHGPEDRLPDAAPTRRFDLVPDGGWAPPSWPAILTAHRRASSSASTHATAIPFQVPPEEANQARERHHTRHFFQAAPLTSYKATDCYIPFWAISATVSTDLDSVDVETDVTVVGPDRKLSTRTKRRNIWLGQRLEPTTYRGDIEEMQVPAGKKYHPSDLRRLRPGTHVAKSRTITPQMLDSQLGGVRRVGAFDVSVRDAVLSLHSWLQAQERRRCEEIAGRQLAGSFSRISVNIRMRIVAVDSKPVYVPAYVYSHRYQVFGMSTKIRTFVSGYDSSRVSGVQVLDPLKVSAVGGLLGLGSALATGAAQMSSSPTAQTVFLYLALPAFATGYAALFYPVLVDLWRQQTAKLGEAIRRAVLGSAERATQDQWSRQGRQGQQGSASASSRTSSGAGSPSQPASGTSADPLGLYRALDAKPSASADEIKAAFRGMALRHHPDRFTDNSDKERATLKFKEVSNAYQVLRDPKKRQLYDYTGKA